MFAYRVVDAFDVVDGTKIWLKATLANMLLRFVAAFGLLILLCYWLIIYLKNLKPKRLKRLQEQQDERSYWQCDQRRKAIRHKYDPENEWNEASTVPEAYSAEMCALNLEYRDVLKRRNGWSEKDFQNTN